MVPMFRMLVPLTIAALICGCSSQGNSPVPPAPQPSGEQAQSVRSVAFSALPTLAFGQPVAMTRAQEMAPQALPASAQSKSGKQVTIPAVNVPVEMQAAAAVPGPPVYITDIHGRLWKMTTGTNAIKFIGNEGVLLTDLGINPINHQLYGISFTSLYRVSETTGHATFVGNLGLSTANALVFAANGAGFVAGENNYGLYAMCSCNGRLGLVGSMYPFTSAGDLTFYDGYLVLSGQIGAYNGSAQDDLILVNPSTGQPLEAVTTGLRVLFGLYSTGTNQLWGFSNTSLYHFTNQVLLVKNFAPYGVGQIYGAAYDGNFQN